MAYSTASPPSLVSKAPLTGLGQEWFYASADAPLVVDTAGFITNGHHLGMKAGDLVKVRETSTGEVTSHRVVSVNATTGAVDLGTGTIIGAVGNLD